MSPEMRRRRDGSSRPRRKSAVQPWAVVWFAVVWCAFWRDVSVANLLSGAALGVLVQWAFPLPPLRFHGTLRPVALLAMLGVFLWQMLRASVDVARQVLRVRRDPAPAVVAVDLESSSDFVLTLTALVVGLIPGSIVVEARRSTHTLFLHVLDAGDAAGVERERRRVLAVERGVTRVLGSDRDDAASTQDEVRP